MSRRRGAAALVVAVVLGGCGDDEPPDPGAEAADGVAAVLAERLDTTPEEIAVTCPDDVAVDPGGEFVCQVAVAGAEPVELDLVVGADGTVELRRAVIPTQAAEAYLADELAGPAEGPVTAECGSAPLLVADVGDDLRCEVVRSSDGAVHAVTVTVLALDGTVRYRVEAAGAVPGATTTTGTTAPP